MPRGLDVRFITGCLPIIAFLALAVWGFNHFVLSPKADAARRRGPATAKESAARMAVRAELNIDARPSGRVYLSGTLGNASPYDVKHVFVTVTYGVRGGSRSSTVNMGEIGAGESRAVSTRLPGVHGDEVDASGGVRVTVSDVRLAQ